MRSSCYDHPAPVDFRGWGNCRAFPNVVAFDFDVVGWEDKAGDRHRGKPADINDTYGQLVHAYDPETGEQHHFWAFIGGILPGWDWEDWVDLIETLIEMYGTAVWQ